MSTANCKSCNWDEGWPICLRDERCPFSPADARRVAHSALERFHANGANEEEKDPLERLRYFCSLAMNGQDWLDVEPFFDAVRATRPTSAQPEPGESPAVPEMVAALQKVIANIEASGDEWGMLAELRALVERTPT